jgi:tRNA pseudouridine38-40 synthase
LVTSERNDTGPGRLALRLAYDGTGFHGWQTQPSGAAVQDALERALAQVAGRPVATVCAGRTDAGVHALSQVVHFDPGVPRPEGAWVRGVNALLPAGVAVQSLAGVDERFSARYSALRRSYAYLIHRGAQRHPLYATRAGWVFRPLDVARMARAAATLVGEHDFSAFRSSQCQAASPVRTLERIELREHGALLAIDLQANAFLHHMVRNLVGALVWVGLGRRDPDWIPELLASRDRTRAAPTFAAQGLYLSGVEYPPRYAIDSWPPVSPLAGPSLDR